MFDDGGIGGVALVVVVDGLGGKTGLFTWDGFGGSGGAILLRAVGEWCSIIFSTWSIHECSIDINAAEFCDFETIASNRLRLVSNLIQACLLMILTAMNKFYVK